jgi:hypothetical protein
LGDKNNTLIFQKIPGKFFFRKPHKNPFLGKKLEKILLTALSPLFRPPKTPYIRGDVRGEGGTILEGGAKHYWSGGLVVPLYLTYKQKKYPTFL